MREFGHGEKIDMLKMEIEWQLERKCEIDGTFPYSTRGTHLHPYAKFLELATRLDLALKERRWEDAEEIAGYILSRKTCTFDRRCVMIVKKLLEDANV